MSNHVKGMTSCRPPKKSNESELKKPCLCIGNGKVIQKLASFDSEEYAEGFYKMLCAWFGLEGEADG